jgi:hypothetical protein
MAGSLQHDHPASSEMIPHIFAHFSRRDNVFAALEHQGRNGDLRQIRPVVGHEGDQGKRLRDIRIGATETIRQLLASTGRSGFPMITGAIAADQPS